MGEGLNDINPEDRSKARPVHLIIITHLNIIQVLYIGQPVGMVVATTEAAAREAAKWLQDKDSAITYTELPGTVTLDDAIEKRNFFYDSTTYENAPSRLLKVKASSYLVFS